MNCMGMYHVADISQKAKNTLRGNRKVSFAHSRQRVPQRLALEIGRPRRGEGPTSEIDSRKYACTHEPASASFAHTGNKHRPYTKVWVGGGGKWLHHKKLGYQCHSKVTP